MFNFLKKKLQGIVGKVSDEVKEDSTEVTAEEIEQKVSIPDEEPIEQAEKKEEPVKESKEKKESKKKEPRVVEEKEPDHKEAPKPRVEEKTEAVTQIKADIQDDPGDESEIVVEESIEKEIIQEEPKKKTFFSKISDTFTKINLSEEKFEEIFWDIELALLESNVAVEVIEKIKTDLKEELTTGKISRKGVEAFISDALKESIKDALDQPEKDLLVEGEKKKPYIIAVIGVNGSGKTTGIAKIAQYLKDNNKTVVLAAADTFRAAAIQQLEEHAKRLDIKMIKHDYNSDPAAVAFDAVKHAEAKGIDYVLIDTAGRMHSNDNLMNELKKLIRVNNPDMKLFVGESITGNDCVDQARTYNELIGIDAIMLTKADIDEKGGAALSISYVTKKPVIFIGTGQEYKDIEKFNKERILDNLGL